MIETMDYNPMMINYYISYMNDAGEDCSEVSQAYDDIVNQLSQTQGIVIGQDIHWIISGISMISVSIQVIWRMALPMV